MKKVQRGWRTRILELGIVVASTAVALLIAEGAFRLVMPPSYFDAEPVLQTGRLAYLPDQTTRFRLAGEIDTVIRINSRGFRDDEYVASPGSRNGVALGDSFTEGWGVDLDRTYVKLVERGLRESIWRYEHVYNAGHSGTNPKNYVATYDEYFREDHSVDLVLLDFCLANDIIEESTPTYRRPPDRGVSYRVKLFFIRHSAVYNFIRRRVRYSQALDVALSRFGIEPAQSIPLDLMATENNRRRWPYTADFIGRFHDQLKSEGRRFLLVLIPTKEMVDDAYFGEFLRVRKLAPEDIDRFGFRDFVLERCRARGIPVIDLTDAFRAASDHPARDLYFESDPHWNEAGHRLAAEAILERLREDTPSGGGPVAGAVSNRAETLGAPARAPARPRVPLGAP